MRAHALAVALVAALALLAAVVSTRREATPDDALQFTKQAENRKSSQERCGGMGGRIALLVGLAVRALPRW